MTEQWRQERPTWCPKADCQFRRRAQDGFCGGELPEALPHDGDMNSHRLCFYGGEGPDSYLLNLSDVEWLRWILDALDGKKTSWQSQIEGR